MNGRARSLQTVISVLAVEPKLAELIAWKKVRRRTQGDVFLALQDV